MAVTTKTGKASIVPMTPERQQLADLQRRISQAEKMAGGTPEAFEARRKQETAADLAKAKAELQIALKAYNGTKPEDPKRPELLSTLRAASQSFLDVLSCGSEWEQKKLKNELEQLHRDALRLRRSVNAKKR